MTAPNLARILAIVFAASTLSACGALAPAKSEEYSTYALDLASTPAAGDPVSWQLRVEEPAAATPLAGAKIAQRDSDGSFGVFRGARWSERAPELIQGAIVRSFEDSGRIRGVGRSTSSVRGDYLLLMELRNFEADYSGSGGPVVRFALSAKLIGAKDNEAVAARVFSETEPAAGRDLAAIVKAFKACAERLIPQLRDWALESGQVQASATPDR